MKFRSKKNILAVILIPVAIAAIFLAQCAGFTSTRSAVRIGYIGNEGWSNWSGRYLSLDGTMQKTIHPKENVLHIEVETESGSISMEIKDADGNILFDQDDLGTAEFDVEVSGKVVVQIRADNHKGSFAIY